MPRKRKRRSWGSITVVNRNKHIIRWPETTPDGRKRRSKTLYVTYAEADLELSRLQIKLADDKPVPTIEMAYLMWYRPWLERRIKDGKTKARTGEIYTRCWETIVQPRWGSVPVSCTPPADIQEWLLGLAPTNAKTALVVLRKIVDLAARYEVVSSNKFRLTYDMPTEKVREKRTGTYTLEEAEAMLAKLKGYTEEAAYILACFGSARVGESLGVHPEEVSLAESHGLQLAVVPIVRRMDLTGDHPLPDGDLKNPQSVRTVVIPEPYGTRLYEIASERKASGSGWMADRGDGLPHNIGTLNYAWNRDAGEDAIPFANLRASWRTFAQYRWRIDRDTLELLMGHLISGVTGRHYLKPNVDDLVDAVALAVSKTR